MIKRHRILGALSLFLESLPMGQISPDSFQNVGNASPRVLRECFSKKTPSSSVQPTVHLRSVNKLFTL
jgi:hypothetical protein